MPLYPQVPDLPGVPPVLRSASNAAAAFVAATPLFTDLLGAVGAPSVQTWGVYDSSNSPAIDADSVVDLTYMKDFEEADYPIEAGSFESYNKVETPFDVRIKLTKGGLDADRAAFLAQIDTVLASLDLYSVVTPEKAYASVNAVRVDYTRAADRGATLITAELRFHQIRADATATFTNTQNPAAQGQVDSGAVQPQVLTPQQAAVADPTAQSSIPVQAVPNQTLTVTLADQNLRFNVGQKTTGLFMDVLNNSVQLAGGVQCRNGADIIQNAYQGFTGNLQWVDTQGHEDPNYTGLGTRWILTYLAAP